MRVSTREQDPGAQRDAPTKVDCEQIFIDHFSGRLARRPELDKALMSANRAGDQIVITKLDRLGRSLAHLIELSIQLQDRRVDLMVLDQNVGTATSTGTGKDDRHPWRTGIRAVEGLDRRVRLRPAP